MEYTHRPLTNCRQTALNQLLASLRGAAAANGASAPPQPQPAQPAQGPQLQPTQEAQPPTAPGVAAPPGIPAHQAFAGQPPAKPNAGQFSGLLAPDVGTFGSLDQARPRLQAAGPGFPGVAVPDATGVFAPSTAPRGQHFQAQPLPAAQPRLGVPGQGSTAAASEWEELPPGFTGVGASGLGFLMQVSFSSI